MNQVSPVPLWVASWRDDAEKFLERKGLPNTPNVEYETSSGLFTAALDHYLEQAEGMQRDCMEVAAGKLIYSAAALEVAPPESRDKWLTEVTYIQTLLVAWRDKGKQGGEGKKGSETELTRTIRKLVADDPELSIDGLMAACRADADDDEEGVFAGLRGQGRSSLKITRVTDAQAWYREGRQQEEKRASRKTLQNKLSEAKKNPES